MIELSAPTDTPHPSDAASPGPCTVTPMTAACPAMMSTVPSMIVTPRPAPTSARLPGSVRSSVQVPAPTWMTSSGPAAQMASWMVG